MKQEHFVDEQKLQKLEKQQQKITQKLIIHDSIIKHF
jgi:hypothetical protein